MACAICEHPQRANIENALVVSDYGATEISLASIAKEYGVKLQDLQVHALMHTPLAQMEGSEVGESIASGIKKNEANLLYATAQEYFITLKSAGREIRQMMANKEDGGARTLTKPLVELYVGTGNNIRQIMESITDMNQKVNGEADSGTQALISLVSAIRGSEK